MAPAAAPGKPRCMVFEGVWCLKVYDIISGPDRWQGSGVSPAAGGEKFWAFFSPSKHTICVCIYIYIYLYIPGLVQVEHKYRVMLTMRSLLSSWRVKQMLVRGDLHALARQSTIDTWHIHICNT